MAVWTPAKPTADPTAADAARIKSLLPQVFENELHERVEAMRAELRSEIERELKAELERRLDAREEDVRREFADRMGKYQSDCENDLQARAEAEAQKLWEQRRDQYVTRLETLREDLDTASNRGTVLEQGLLALLTAVFPQMDQYRAIARHCSIDSFDMTTIAPALAAINRRLAFRTSESAHSIMLKLEGGSKIVHLACLKQNHPVNIDPRTEEVRIDGPAQ